MTIPMPLYGAMSWNHETGASFAGFWPSATEVVKLSRRNLRSYLVSACLAGCPYDPHEPGVPVVDPIGPVTPPFTVDWTDAANASSYALQRLQGYQVLVDDQGDSGPFDRVNWIMTTSQYHSSPQCYLSNGTGTLTWQETVTIPENGGGRISFWSMQNISPESYQAPFHTARRRSELVLPADIRQERHDLAVQHDTSSTNSRAKH